MYLAESLLPLIAKEPENAQACLAPVVEALATLAPQYDGALLNGIRCKHVITEPRNTDDGLIRELLRHMDDNQADFTITFRNLCDAAANPAADANVRSLSPTRPPSTAWLSNGPVVWTLKPQTQPIAPPLCAAPTRYSFFAVICRRRHPGRRPAQPTATRFREPR
jgi:uncharacterized protein YdiU (UPF0061 family)